MTDPALSVWRREYLVELNQSDESTFEVDIPIIGDGHDWHGWAWFRSR